MLTKIMSITGSLWVGNKLQNAGSISASVGHSFTPLHPRVWPFLRIRPILSWR